MNPLVEKKGNLSLAEQVAWNLAWQTEHSLLNLSPQVTTQLELLRQDHQLRASFTLSIAANSRHLVMPVTKTAPVPSPSPGLADSVNKALMAESGQQTQEYVQSLELELREGRERLQAFLEKLDISQQNLHSFNEKLLSVNQELQTDNNKKQSINDEMQIVNEALQRVNKKKKSTNDEMQIVNDKNQSVNKEMQTTNEELQSVNGEHKVKIRELTELNDDLNNYFYSNVSGQLFVDKDLLLRKFSPAAVQHINLRKDDIGRSLNHITTNIRFDTLVEDIRQVIFGGETLTKEVQAITGEWFQMMVMPYLRQVDHQPDGAMVTFYNINTLKQVQQELDLSNQSLSRINADLDNFVYAASHDMMSPLANISSLLALLQTKMPSNDPKVIQLYELMNSSLAKFKSVIRELGTIAKVESEMLKQAEAVDIADMLGEIRLSMGEQITAIGAIVRVDLQESQIRFSPKNLRSLLSNLVSNALKYRSTDRIPDILIGTRREDNFIVLSVSDNGVGIGAGQLTSVFSLYNQLNPATEGQGIGLYLVRKIIDANGGRVEVESEPGLGTTFRLYFKN